MHSGYVYILFLTIGLYVHFLFLVQHVVDDGAKTVFIKNISSSEIRELREVLTNIRSVKNYMPLLNKV